jgi:tRNA-2-methylthio-N6-dimethylallyladenosine synthase
MPMIHLPVQSGSNKILKLMNRKHSIEEYLEIINNLVKAKPDIKFSSDFIIGYPGETSDDFKESLKLLRKIKFINIFSFVFSPRPGTPAYNLNKINEKEAKDRLKEFQCIAEEIKYNYRNNLIKEKAKVLFENKIRKENKYFGRDEYFNPIIVESKTDLTGKIKIVEILKGNRNILTGKIIPSLNQTNYAA